MILSSVGGVLYGFSPSLKAETVNRVGLMQVRCGSRACLKGDCFTDRRPLKAVQAEIMLACIVYVGQGV